MQNIYKNDPELLKKVIQIESSNGISLAGWIDGNRTTEGLDLLNQLPIKTHVIKQIAALKNYQEQNKGISQSKLRKAIKTAGEKAIAELALLFKDDSESFAEALNLITSSQGALLLQLLPHHAILEKEKPLFSRLIKEVCLCKPPPHRRTKFDQALLQLNQLLEEEKLSFLKQLQVKFQQ